MAHAGDAFKTNSAHAIRAVKESNQPAGAGCPPRNRTDQNSCKKFSQNAAFAEKMDSLPPKHTFTWAKKQAILPPPGSADSGFPND